MASPDSDLSAVKSPKSQRMDNGALKALLAAERMSALAAMQSSKLSGERTDALMYYMNDMSKDMPSQDGRSKAVSSDVADTIEGLMPQMMEIFAGSEEVVKFNPVGPEDIKAAEQETDYINHVMMNQNPGFLVLYSFIKDALLEKVGVVKVWWEEKEVEERETYYGLTDDQFGIISADKDVEIVEHTKRPPDDKELLQILTQQEMAEGNNQIPELHDIVAIKSKTFAEAKVLGVPPEEFGIEKTARSIRNCNYCFHRVIKTQGELIAQGYDEGQVKSLPTYMAITNTEEIARDTVDEHQNVGEEQNPGSRRIEINEHYVRMDYEGDGKVRLYKVSTGPEMDFMLLEKNGDLDLEEIDQMPFAAMTPIIVSHRFFGRSLADLVMEIQRIKTALIRGQLDNQYLVNNQRVEVSEQYASENTLDDLLISRQGGIVRTKTPGGLKWQEVPSIGNSNFPMIEYMDSVREMRTGVTRVGQGIDADALQNQSATAVNQMFTMAQARMKLIARVFAETGIKDLFLLLHAVIRKHGQEARTVRLRNQWVNVDPREWKKRDDMTVEVGLGTGGKAEQMAMVNLIIGMQEKALQGGLTNLVTPNNLYNSAKALTRIAGHKDVDAFFTDPATQPPPQAPQDPKLQIELIKAQSQEKLQQQKMQLEAVHEQAKFQADAALEQQKFEHEKELDYLEMGMKREEHAHKMQIATHQANIQAATAQHGMAVENTKLQQAEAKAQHKEAKGGTTIIAGDKGAQSLTDGFTGGFKQMSDHFTKMHEQSMQAHKETAEAIGHMLKHASAPRKIIRGKDGKISHVETSH